jgi:excinuclease ABC subunit B
MKFKLVSSFKPTGDQPAAIEKLVANLNLGARHQTLLGVTGSGKTFTMANVIEHVQKPALVISHNKTLAAQLYQEFKEFFPENAVHYFVSYYDYYQPEAYIPQTDTYIEKDAKINDLIDALRHASTASLLTRRDVIIVASVSCIYGIGDPEEYQKISMELKVGEKVSQKELIRHLTLLQYTRNPVDPRQGHFRVRENVVEIYLPSGESKLTVEIKNGKIANLNESQANGRELRIKKMQSYRIFPSKHFVTPQNKLEIAIENIKKELKERLADLKKQGKILEAARLKQRTEFDMEMLKQTGYINGIENYSRHLDFRAPGTPPHTLIDYFNYAYGGSRIHAGSPISKNWLCIIDESHVTIPQLRGMYQGDRSRKETLIEYGFRLPSALDNRPLKFEEFNKKVGQVIYVSATPAPYEISRSKMIRGRTSYHLVVEQLIRPTGILDPEIEIRPTKNQIRDVINEIKKRSAKNERSLVMALTKRLAEDIAEYLSEEGIKAEYLHSEIKTLERPERLAKLRKGEVEVMVGINLLREGLDLPEVSFIAILDADKEGFLRNETTLLQIIGRAARHIDGKVILYADTVTGSMKAAIKETSRRRKIQEEYNRAHGIAPKQIQKEIRKSLLEEAKKDEKIPLPEGPAKEIIKALEREMKKAVKELNFELAAKIRDRIKQLTNQ